MKTCNVIQHAMEKEQAEKTKKCSISGFSRGDDLGRAHEKNTLSFIVFSFSKNAERWVEKKKLGGWKLFLQERELMGRRTRRTSNAKTRSSSCAPENLFHTIRGLLLLSKILLALLLFVLNGAFFDLHSRKL